MKISSVKFITSSPSFKETTTLEEHSEYAFIGRSNVGKSSLINMLTKTTLAKTSSTPGKTQLINHYLVNNNWFLVDLPGYGYAKTSKKNRKEFNVFSKEYLTKSKRLRCIFLLIDIRIKPQKNDMEFINWLGAEKLPFIRVFSKADKLTHYQISRTIKDHNNLLLKSWESVPKHIISSSKNKTGRMEILDEIEKINTLKATHS